ncbi:hypothetical protein QEN19_002706 [Hanseniaspora menglaensis]
MPLKNKNQFSHFDFLKSFIIDNSAKNINENIVNIKKLLYYILFNEPYVKHKRRAKLCNFISIFLSNIDVGNNQYDGFVDLLHDSASNPVKVPLSNLQDSKINALSLLNTIYEKLIDLNNSLESSSLLSKNYIISSIMHCLKNINDLYEKYSIGDINKQFYIILKNHQVFESVDVEELEECIELIKKSLESYKFKHSNGGGGVAVSFTFLVCDDQNNLDGFFDSKLKWFCTQLDSFATEFNYVTTNITTLKKVTKFYEFEDYQRIESKIVFQGNLILNSEFLNVYDENFKKNSIPVMGYPAIKKVKPKPRKMMQVLQTPNGEIRDNGNKIKSEAFKAYKKNVTQNHDDSEPLEYPATDLNDALNLIPQQIANTYRLGDSYQLLSTEEEEELLKLKIPYKNLLMKDLDNLNTFETGVKYKNALYSKSIVPLYTLPKDELPFENFNGESQMIVCDFYSPNIVINKADYLSFIAFVDVLKENNLVAIGRYLKKDANYDLSLCCLAPCVNLIDEVKYRSLIVTKLNFGSENYINASSVKSEVAESVTENRFDGGDYKVAGDKNLKKMVSNFIEGNIMDLGAYTGSAGYLYVKDRIISGDFFLKQNATISEFPCNNISNVIMEQELNNLTIQSLHKGNADTFRKEVEKKTRIQETKISGLDFVSDLKQQKQLRSRFNVKKMYSTELLRKQQIVTKENYVPNKKLKIMLKNISKNFDIKINNEYSKKKIKKLSDGQ